MEKLLGYNGVAGTTESASSGANRAYYFSEGFIAKKGSMLKAYFYNPTVQTASKVIKIAVSDANGHLIAYTSEISLTTIGLKVADIQGNIKDGLHFISFICEVNSVDYASDGSANKVTQFTSDYVNPIDFTPAVTNIDAGVPRVWIEGKPESKIRKPLFIKKTRTKKPNQHVELDRAHKFYPNKLCCIFNGSARINQLDLSSGLMFTPYNSGAGADSEYYTQVYKNDGLVLNSTQSGTDRAGLSIPKPFSLSATIPWEITFRVKRNAFSSFGMMIGDDSNTTDYIALLNSGPLIRLLNSVGVSSEVSGFSDFTAEMVTYTITSDGGGASSCKFRAYAEGVLKGTVNSATPTLVCNEILTAYSGSNNLDFGGLISHMRVSEGTLYSDEMVKELHANLYQVLNKRKIVRTVKPEYNIIKKVRNKKPNNISQIDWSNQLTKGLALFAIVHKGKFYDYVSQTFGTDAAAPTYGIGEEGEKATFSGDKVVFSDVLKNALGTGKLSYVVRAKHSGSESAYQTPVSIEDDLGMYAPSSSQDRLGSDAIAGGQATYSAIGTIKEQYQTLGISFLGSTLSSRGFIDGVFQNADTQTYNVGTTLRDINIGVGQASEFYYGDIKFVMVFEGVALSDAVQKELHDNPYQILKPKNIYTEKPTDPVLSVFKKTLTKKPNIVKSLKDKYQSSLVLGLPFDSTYPERDLKNKVHTSTGFNKAISQDGLIASIAATSDLTLDTSTEIGQSRGTIIFAIRPSWGLASGGTLTFCTDDTAGSTVLRVTYDSNSGQKKFKLWYRGNSGNHLFLETPAFTSDSELQQRHIIAFDWDIVQGGHAYLNGKLVETDATTTNAFSSTQPTWNMFLTGAGGMASATKEVEFYYQFDRVLNQNELEAITKNPNLLYEYKNIYFEPTVSAIIEGQLTVQDCLHNVLADSFALTQANSLAVQETLHANAADNVVLNTGVDLVVQETLHAHDVESPALTQANVLAVDETLHSHLVDNVLLSTAGQLVVQDANHTQFVDNVDLIQSNILAVSEALHSVTADNVNLVQANILAVDETLHAVNVDNIALNVSVFLVVSDTLHSTAVDEPVLTQANLLTINSALHSVGVENVALTQANTLVVDDAVHAHLTDSIALILDGAYTTPDDRIFLVESDDRVFLVLSGLEDRIFTIDKEVR